jgi:hypothetical protein
MRPTQSSWLVVVALFASALSLYAFTIRRPPPADDTVSPSANPAFRHWDLREFPDCVVPYSFRDGTADVGGEFAAVDASFAAWQAVSPAIIEFNRVLPVAGAMCPGQIDSHNLIGWNAAGCAGPGDDIAGPFGAACGAALPPGGIIVQPGPDGILTSSRNQCPGAGDDIVVGNFIIDGGNGVIDTVPNALPAGVLGQTFVFYQLLPAGRILEADILFNDVSSAWAITANQAATPTRAEVQTVALHEIGHFFGLGHVPSGPDNDVAPFGNFPGPEDTDANGNGVLDTPIMDSPTSTALHSLSDDDTDGINFLYTPDLGDAPDGVAGFNRYPSFVHGPPPNRSLNGVKLVETAAGALHLFGFFHGGGAAPRYQYEWLGTATGRIDDHPAECEARVVNRDQFDDGVTFGGPLFGAFEPGGPAIPITVHVRTSADRRGNSHVYDTAREMYINGWFDWNADGDWNDGGEHAIGAAAGAFAVTAAGDYVFNIAAPAGARNGGYSRFRLDYMEDVGQVRTFDHTLDLSRGAAQFGEVEDYPLVYARSVVQIHVIGPIPNQVPVGQHATIQATVQAKYDAVPGANVTFAKAFGAFNFAGGTVSADGKSSKVVTNNNGVATVTVVPTAPGPSVVRVTVAGSSLAAHAIFWGIP